MLGKSGTEPATPALLLYNRKSDAIVHIRQQFTWQAGNGLLLSRSNKWPMPTNHSKRRVLTKLLNYYFFKHHNCHWQKNRTHFSLLFPINEKTNSGNANLIHLCLKKKWYSISNSYWDRLFSCLIVFVKPWSLQYCEALVYSSFATTG